MADFLLVHGSWHGAWCWRDLIPELSALGHTARAIDLPSHGSDPTPVADVTLEMCRNAVLNASTSETIVVGHSWGGFPISAAADANPDAMRGLIYVCAYVPDAGHSLIEMRKRAPRQLIGDALEKAADGSSYSVLPDRVHALLYHDCPSDIVTYALARLCPQAIRPQDTGLPVGDGFEQVRKAYIRTTDDRIVPTEYQSKMSECAAPHLRFSIESSHSPFFAQPRKLAKLMDEAAQQM
ncbi:MAG: alpha/beta fold hydrolase [Ruegeria sp.]